MQLVGKYKAEQAEKMATGDGLRQCWKVEVEVIQVPASVRGLVVVSELRILAKKEANHAETAAGSKIMGITHPQEALEPAQELDGIKGWAVRRRKIAVVQMQS